jgi:penicillin-binding protein 1A
VLTARTTVDLTLQRQADEALTAALRKSGRSDHFNSGAIVVMETDGKVRAIVGGPDYGESQFNRATHAKRQPGSSFKIYVYATAMENGYTPDSIVRDASRSCGNWSPSNYGGGGGSGGRLPLWMALAKSLNTVAAELSFAVGREKVIEMTKRLGISDVKKTCSLALGDGGITVLEHTGGIATFANGGKLAHPYGILDITTSKGDLLYSRERDEPPEPQAVSQHVAEEMNTMLNRVITQGTGGAAALDFTNVAGKTGTSTGPKDAWFMGFTGKYVAGVCIGNDDNRPMRSGVTGGHQAAPIWHDLMTVAHTDMNIPTIPGIPPHPRQIEEQQRVAALKAAQVAAGLEPAGPQLPTEAAAKPQSILPEKTRDALKVLAVALRKASGVGDMPPVPGAGSSPAPQSHDPPAPPDGASKSEPHQPTSNRSDRRAALFDMSRDDLSIPAAAPVPRLSPGPQ